MGPMNKFYSLIALALLAVAAPAQAAPAHPVLLISIDGLPPADVFQARKLGLKLPVLSRLVQTGTYATAVHNALATQTYPDHITLITGVWPRDHHVDFNAWFDPLRKPQVRPWRAPDIKVPTLFGAVHRSGGVVAAIGWPVTAGASDIDQNIPEYGRVQHPEDITEAMAQITPGLLPRLERETSIPFRIVYGNHVPHDAARARYVAAMLTDFKPRLLAVHMSSLDNAEHHGGPASREAYEALEAIDSEVGAMMAAARKAQPDSVIAVVSDHGFAPVQHDVELAPAFVAAGLITLDNAGKITAWQAQPWAASGSFAVILARPRDAALKAKVAGLLKRITADPRNGLGQMIDEKQIAAMGGSRQASFWVDCLPGYEPGSKLTGDMVVAPLNKGTHGYLPTYPQMWSSFFLQGPGIAAHQSLGEIDMRDIAPTLARIAGASLPSATGKPLF